ncbi:MAG: hypothetical protein AB7U48_09965 [Bauldia sp.]
MSTSILSLQDEWLALRKALPIVGELSDDDGLRLSQLADDREREILKRPAESVVDVMAKLDVLKFWMECGAVDGDLEAVDTIKADLTRLGATIAMQVAAGRAKSSV